MGSQERPLVAGLSQPQADVWLPCGPVIIEIESGLNLATPTVLML